MRTSRAPAAASVCPSAVSTTVTLQNNSLEKYEKLVSTNLDHFYPAERTNRAASAASEYPSAVSNTSTPSGVCSECAAPVACPSDVRFRFGEDVRSGTADLAPECERRARGSAAPPRALWDPLCRPG